MLQDKVDIKRFKVNSNQFKLEVDPVAVEEPMQISISQGAKYENYSLTMRTPGHDTELVYGILFSEGVICSASNVISLKIDDTEPASYGNGYLVQISRDIELNLSSKLRRHASYSGCGLCGKTSLQALELRRERDLKTIKTRLSNQLVESLKGLLAEQPLFSQTGGVHAAGLIYEEEGELRTGISPFFEDVGRHNALDKLIGHELLINDLAQAGILVLSGRIGFELVQKAVMAGFSIMVALGAPSNLAIQTANQFGIALIGFAKNRSFNLYTADKGLLGKAV
ncbi:formate dehydrogenase accessory sulfurtransferase FdhD [Aliikangiella sp. IMCC44359]|uniref:formate dehydrogenase accessory sulfurtransferase FdhD n=1 Tax=Aliikangiella sp. IMCC44359 TaxID=3459125 RepID=UPI00403A9719